MPRSSVERGEGDGLIQWRKPSDDDLYARFTAYLVSELGRSPRTAESYVSAIKSAARFADKPASVVTSDDLRALLRDDHYAPATKRGVVVACRQFHYWGNVEGLWHLNGMASLKTPKVARAPLPPMDQNNAQRALSHCASPLTFRIAYGGLYAGLRISESEQLSEDTWRDHWLTIIGKGNKKRRIPVHPELAKVRPLILAKSPNRRTLEVTWTRYRDRHELVTIEGTKATTHSLRRTFATTMYDEGVPWEQVARLLGHGEDVTASYARISDDDLESDVKVVRYNRGEPIQGRLFE